MSEWVNEWVSGGSRWWSRGERITYRRTLELWKIVDDDDVDEDDDDDDDNDDNDDDDDGDFFTKASSAFSLPILSISYGQLDAEA